MHQNWFEGNIVNFGLCKMGWYQLGVQNYGNILEKGQDERYEWIVQPKTEEILKMFGFV